jgi:hypothetical protein
MILNFNFDRINIERSKEAPKTIDAKNNLKILSIEEDKLPIDQQKILKFIFQFSVDYEPKVAKLEFHGHLTYLNEEKKMKEILSSWSKEKKIPPEVSAPVMNFLLTKCNIRALSLAQDFNLPAHIPFPRIALKSEATK